MSDGIEKVQQAALRYPSSGKLIGDWRQGERIAQSGVGKQFTDDLNRPAGGSCYNCTSSRSRNCPLVPSGPSLYQFASCAAQAKRSRSTLTAKSTTPRHSLACSNMPRFGHNGVLTEEQITNLVALLLDPESPVNK